MDACTVERSGPRIQGFQSMGVIQLGLGLEDGAQSPPAVDVPPKAQEPKKKQAPARRSKTLVLDAVEGAVQPLLTGMDAKAYVVGLHHLKHPKVFPPPTAKGLADVRTLIVKQGSCSYPERSITLLGNSVTNCYTTNTLAVMAVINDMWQEQGGGDEGAVIGSYAEMVRRLNWDVDNESKSRAKVKKELERLRRLVLIFTNYDAEKELQHSKEITYLSDYDYVKDRRYSRKNHFRVCIDKYIVRGISMGFIASLPIKSLVETKENESKTILLRVDSLMPYNTKVSMNQAVFLDLLCVEPDSWLLLRKSFARKLMERVAYDLNGRVLTNGCILKARFRDDPRAGHVIDFERGEVVMPKSIRPEMSNSDATLVKRLQAEMMQAVGAQPQDNVDGLYELYARMYPEEIIQRAVSVFHADKPRTHALMSAGAFFSSILARLVRERGLAWVRR